MNILLLSLLLLSLPSRSFFFFFNDTATTEIYTLSLHDALPISPDPGHPAPQRGRDHRPDQGQHRSEEHTSELQSPCNLVCRLLLEKKKKLTSHKPFLVVCVKHYIRSAARCLPVPRSQSYVPDTH